MVHVIKYPGFGFETRKFNDGDRVEAKGYGGILVIDGIDEDLTRALKKTQYRTIAEDYLLGKRKVDNGEVYSEDELSFVLNEKGEKTIHRFGSHEG